MIINKVMFMGGNIRNIYIDIIRQEINPRKSIREYNRRTYGCVFTVNRDESVLSKCRTTIFEYHCEELWRPQKPLNKIKKKIQKRGKKTNFC